MRSGKLRKEGCVERVVAVLVGIAVMVTLSTWLTLAWYWAILIGMATYLASRYVAYFIRERRRIRTEMNEAIKAYERPKNSN